MAQVGKETTSVWVALTTVEDWCAVVFLVLPSRYLLTFTNSELDILPSPG